MTAEIFRYDDLTWPEIAALPRDIPLLLPLGEGYNLSLLPPLLEDTPRIGLLPTLSFGWPGSDLEVPAETFNVIVSNLLANLHEDGFPSASALVPPGLKLPPEIPQLTLPRQNHGVKLFSENDIGKVVVIPIGQTEQHGYHAPLSTDTIIIEAIAQGLAAAVPDQAACLPVTPYGVSMHRRSFAGTFNVGGRAFEDFWLSVIDNLVHRGFTRFYLISGHGGNSSFLVNAVKYAGERYPHIFCATAWLYLSGPKGVAALEKMRQSGLGGMGHACELETSLLLHLRPDLVHMERAVDETDFVSTPSYYMDWVEGGALVANPPWEDDTKTGAYGAGSLGTAEKGKFWLDVAIAEKVDHIAEIHEQYKRRRERHGQRASASPHIIK